MIKPILSIFILISCSSICQASILKEYWDKYQDIAIQQNKDNVFAKNIETQDTDKQQKKLRQYPGKIISTSNFDDIQQLNQSWKYRQDTYEILADVNTKISKQIYSLALYSKDIDENLPKEKFYKNVNGFHYSLEQVLNWANSTLRSNTQITSEELAFINMLLSDNIIKLQNNTFISTNKVKHILGAAPGKKSSLQYNLKHERLHIFWDMDSKLRQQWHTKFNNLSDKERKKVLDKFKNYNQDNIEQIIEEWTITSLLLDNSYNFL